MILSDKMINAAMIDGDIVIDPFDPKALGSNSYDVHLGSTILTYTTKADELLLDCMVEPATREHSIGPAGIVLVPGVLYLGATVEYTRTQRHVPFLDGKSSIGRLGITIHCTAGRGDVGWHGHWTLEIHVIQPVRVYAGMAIGQLIYFDTGPVDMPYDEKPGAKYNNRDPKPQASRMWKNFKNGKNA